MSKKKIIEELLEIKEMVDKIQKRHNYIEKQLQEIKREYNQALNKTPGMTQGTLPPLKDNLYLSPSEIQRKQGRGWTHITELKNDINPENFIPREEAWKKANPGIFVPDPVKEFLEDYHKATRDIHFLKVKDRDRFKPIRIKLLKAFKLNF